MMEKLQKCVKFSAAKATNLIVFVCPVGSLTSRAETSHSRAEQFCAAALPAQTQSVRTRLLPLQDCFRWMKGTAPLPLSYSFFPLSQLSNIKKKVLAPRGGAPTSFFFPHFP